MQSSHTHTCESFFSGTFIILRDVIFQHKKKNIPVMTISIFKLASGRKKKKSKQSAIKICSKERE